MVENMVDHRTSEIAAPIKKRSAEIKAILNSEGYVRRKIGIGFDKPECGFWLSPKYSKGKFVGERDLGNAGRAVLLGNAGSGKSTVIQYAFTELAENYLSGTSEVVPFLFHLGKEVGNDFDLLKWIDHSYDGAFSKCVDKGLKVCLLIDGLEDAIALRKPFIVNDLEYFIQQYEPNLASLVIACRRFFWRANLFKKVGLAGLSVDALFYEDYEELFPKPKDLQNFTSQCAASGISELLENPFDGFYLARRFLTKQALPKSRLECLKQRVDAAFAPKGSGDGTHRSQPIPELRVLAEQVACILTFSGTRSLKQQDLFDLLSVEYLGNNRATEAKIETIIDSALFESTAGAVSFRHDLYREYLVASALNKVSLRKQRMLLNSTFPTKELVNVAHRGIAAFLSQFSKSYFDHIASKEPLLALFCEVSWQSAKQNEALLERVIDAAISRGEAPWSVVTPQGESAMDVLRHHKVPNSEKFLRQYLSADNEFSKLWSTLCAREWGGVSKLNAALIELALDVNQHEHARTWAIESVGKTALGTAIKRLYPLLKDKNDSIRGTVLALYRKTQRPSPAQYLKLLEGGSQQQNTVGPLQFELRNFVEDLSKTQLPESFDTLADNYHKYSDLGCRLAGALFKRAADLEYEGIDIAFIFSFFTSYAEDRVYFLDQLKTLLRHQSNISIELWKHSINKFVSKEESEGLYPFLVAKFIDDLLTEDQVFSALPRRSDLNDDQYWLVSDVLRKKFSDDLSVEHLEKFQQMALEYCSDWKLPRSKPLKDSGRDLLAERQALTDALANGKSAIDQTRLLLEATKSIWDERRDDVNGKKLAEYLSEFPRVLLEKILDCFSKCIKAIAYTRKEVEVMGPNASYQQTLQYWRLPLQVLREFDVKIPDEKLAEYLTCYGFMYSNDRAESEELSSELRERNSVVWEKLMSGLIIDERVRTYYIIEHVSGFRDPVLLNIARERLRTMNVDAESFRSWLAYWRMLKVTDFSDVLRTCYLLLSKQSQKKGTHFNGLNVAVAKFEPLLLLMSDNNRWAWQRFKRLLQSGRVPTQYLAIPDFNVPKERIVDLADWYAFIRKAQGSEIRIIDMADVLLEKMLSIDVSKTIAELRRLQFSDAFPHARWLGMIIVRLQDRIQGTPRTIEAAELVRFLNSEQRAIVLEEKDLFEWVCDAIEDLKEDVELRAEGTAGYWDEDKPKQEVPCQNVLWPNLKLRLANKGLTEIEEKQIGANRADFWIMLTKRDGTKFQVAIELKTARMGYGVSDLIDPVKTQLVQKYLQRSKSYHGLFIVLWFKDQKRYSGPSSWNSSQDLLTDLQVASEKVLNEFECVVKPYVLDLTTKYRKH
jgi:hypothetical protein